MPEREATVDRNQLEDRSFWQSTQPLPFDDVNNPTSGGKFEPGLKLTDTKVIFKPADRNSSPQEPQETYLEVQITYGLGENSRLKNTGWNSAKEGRRLFENYNQNIRSGKTPKEALVITYGELELNIRHYVREFVQAGVVLPDNKKIQEVGGVRRMVGDNGVPVVDGITRKERYGSVWDAAMQSDQYLSEPIPLTGSPEEAVWKVAVTNSPKDWNGITRPYVDNQTIVSWVDEAGILHGATLVTDLDQVKSRQLSIDLGVDGNLLIGGTGEERISNIVRNPALFTFPKSNQNPVEYVFDKILALRGMSDIRLEQLDGSMEYRSVEGAKKDIKRLDELLKFNQKCEGYLSRLKDFIFRQINNLDSGFSQQKIMTEIDQTILLITDDHLPVPALPSIWVLNPDAATIRQDELDDRNLRDRLERAVAFLETRAGCSQGGGSTLTQLRGISLGSGVRSIGGILEGERGKKGKSCIICGEVNYCTKNCYKCNGMLI